MEMYRKYRDRLFNIRYSYRGKNIAMHRYTGVSLQAWLALISPNLLTLHLQQLSNANLFHLITADGWYSIEN